MTPGRPASGSDRYIPEGERVILSIRPDPAFIVLAPMWTLAGLACVGACGAWAAARWPGVLAGWLTPVEAGLWAALAMLAVVAWHAVERAARRYILTDRRVMRVRGVFRRSVVDAPLDRLQHAVVTRLVRERLTGLGTLGFATAGTAWTEVHWVMIARPIETMAEVRRAIDAARPGGTP